MSAAKPRHGLWQITVRGNVCHQPVDILSETAVCYRIRARAPVVLNDCILEVGQTARVPKDAVLLPNQEAAE